MMPLRKAFPVLAPAALLILAPILANAAAPDSYISAYETAVALSRQAAANKNQWPATTTALAEAKAAAAAGDYDKALASAREAEALARASIHQSESEARAWKDAEIR